MIKSFRHKGLRKFFEKNDSSKIYQAHVKRLKLILTQLHAADDITDMNFPGSHLHSLSGNRRDFWAVRISGNWRIIFRFQDSDAYDVDYPDYH